MRVHLPDPLVRLFPGADRTVEVAPGTVADMVAQLDARWPGMAGRICDETPAVRRHMNVFVDGERAGLGTVLAPGAEVFVMTAVSGG